MSMHHLISLLEGLPQDHTTLETAFQIATKFKASLEAIHIQVDGRDTIPLIGQGISAPVVEQIITSLEAEGSEIKRKAKTNLADFCKSKELRMIKDSEETSDKAISYHEHVGRAAEILPELARLSDLCIMSQHSAKSDDMSRLTTEETVLESGNMVLLAVPDVPADIGSTVVFYWNGSRESARFLSTALPFFKQAKKVYMIVADSEDHLGPEGELAARSLGRRGVKAELIKIDDHKDRLAEHILVKAIELKADLLMMGAYTHSKLRQWIMGSMTDYMMNHTTIPLLLIH